MTDILWKYPTPECIQCKLWLWPRRGGEYRGCHGRCGGRGGGAGAGGGGGVRHRGGGGGGQDPGLGLQLGVLPTQLQVDIYYLYKVDVDISSPFDWSVPDKGRHTIEILSQ